MYERLIQKRAEYQDAMEQVARLLNNGVTPSGRITSATVKLDSKGRVYARATMQMSDWIDPTTRIAE